MFSIENALELAAFIGVPMGEFWEMTPYELTLVAKSYVKRQEIRQQESVIQAYLISRWVWTKNVNIEKILKELGIKKEKKVMSDIDMLNQVKILNSLFGGTVIEKQDKV